MKSAITPGDPWWRVLRSDWVMLTRVPLAFGPFKHRNEAQRFANRKGGVVLEWLEPHPITEGCPPDFGAVWFNGDWNRPVVVGPFYATDNAAKWGEGHGIAVELDEFPEESDYDA